MKIAVSIGHHPSAQGASNSLGHTEYEEMATLAGLVVSKLTMLKHQAYVIGSGILTHKINAINSVLFFDCAVELHLNADPDNDTNTTIVGRGCETLYCPGSSVGKALAESVQNSLANRAGLVSRGAKEGWYRMQQGGTPDAFLAKIHAPAIIVEPWFIDNPEEQLRMFSVKEKEKIALAIAVGISDWNGG